MLLAKLIWILKRKAGRENTWETSKGINMYKKYILKNDKKEYKRSNLKAKSQNVLIFLYVFEFYSKSIFGDIGVIINGSQKEKLVITESNNYYTNF